MVCTRRFVLRYQRARGGAGAHEATRVQWVMRRNIRVNRAATAWFISRFADRQAHFLFAEPEDVAHIQKMAFGLGT